MKKMTQEELIAILQKKVGKDISLSDHLEYDLGRYGRDCRGSGF